MHGEIQRDVTSDTHPQQFSKASQLFLTRRVTLFRRRVPKRFFVSPIRANTHIRAHTQNVWAQEYTCSSRFLLFFFPK